MDNTLKIPEEISPVVRPILTWPDPLLSRRAEEITDFSDIDQLRADMFVTMRVYDGIGLAGPQIGEMKRAITLWINPYNPLFFANPVIVETSEELFEVDEGCLSVPGFFEKRKRPQKVVVRYQNEKGNEKERELYDLHAFALQHEIDHLNGKTFVDDVNSLKRSLVKRKITKFLRKHPELMYKR